MPKKQIINTISQIEDTTTQIFKGVEPQYETLNKEETVDLYQQIEEYLADKIIIEFKTFLMTKLAKENLYSTIQINKETKNYLQAINKVLGELSEYKESKWGELKKESL